MKKAFVLLLFALLVGASFACAAEVGSKNNERFRAGLGIGVPYGVLGGNLEVFPVNLISLFLGLGATPAGAGWSIGARLYPFGSQKQFNPRLSVLHGVVAYLETKYWYGTSTYETIDGNALGLGFDWIFSNKYSLDFDVVFLDYSLPAGAKEQGGKTKISIGYGYHF